MNRHIIWLCGIAVIAAGCHYNKPFGSAGRVSEFEAGKAGNDDKLRGFYESTGSWRWTSRVFSVTLDPPETTGDICLELDMDLPREIMGVSGAVTLTARVNGVSVGSEHYTTMGRRIFACRVPAAALATRPAIAEFELDQQAKGPGNRVLGLIAFSAGLKDWEETAAHRAAESAKAREAYARMRSAGGATDRDLMVLFHRYPVWENIWFQNVRLEKNPTDLWIMQQLFYELRPDFIVETGTWRGGSALYWASLLDGMGLADSRVLTVDLQASAQTASTNPLWRKHVEFFLGSSTDPDIVSRIARRTRGRKTLVMLDSDHAKRHVLRELRMYAPLVSRGSYIIVEDTHMDGVPTYPEDGPGPMAAVLEFLEKGGSANFEQDLSRESLAMTFNPGGWLRRK